MNYSFKHRRGGLWILIACVLLIALSVPESHADGVGINNRYGTFYNSPTNFPLLLTNGQTATITSTNSVPIYPNRGMAIFITGGCSNATTMTNIQATFDVTYNGTNWTTVKPLTNTVSVGATAFTGYGLFIADSLNNARAIRLTTLWNNGAYSATVSNVIWSVYP